MKKYANLIALYTGLKRSFERYSDEFDKFIIIDQHFLTDVIQGCIIYFYYYMELLLQVIYCMNKIILW